MTNSASWYQAIRYAKEHDRDLLIVTRDQKEDWWWRQNSEFIGPHPELTLEYQQLTGRRLFLMRPAAFNRADRDDEIRLLS